MDLNSATLIKQLRKKEIFSLKIIGIVLRHYVNTRTTKVAEMTNW